MSDVMELVSELTTRVKTIEAKLVKQDKMIKKLKKQLNPVDKEKKPKTPSGFAKPIYISPELCTFLGLDVGTEIPRTEVTKQVLQYVKDNNLQNSQFRKNIDFDNTLTELLKPQEGEVVTFFTIQKLLKKHYVKPDSVEGKTEPVVAEPVVAEPVVAEPVVAEPVVAEPVVEQKAKKKQTKKKT